MSPFTFHDQVDFFYSITLVVAASRVCRNIVRLGSYSARQSAAKANAQTPLTLEGELNKLAANISVGRNMAGVHCFSDYYDSLRMGEEVAIGILEEQALTYPKDSFALSLVTFDGVQRKR